jgi:hypothetical protein
MVGLRKRSGPPEVTIPKSYFGHAPWGLCPMRGLPHAGGVLVCGACGQRRPTTSKGGTRE